MDRRERYKMKVKELIKYLKELDQEKDIGIHDDGDHLHIESYLDGDKAYILAGSYGHSFPFVDGEWKEFK